MAWLCTKATSAHSSALKTTSEKSRAATSAASASRTSTTSRSVISSRRSRSSKRSGSWKYKSGCYRLGDPMRSPNFTALHSPPPHIPYHTMSIRTDRVARLLQREVADLLQSDFVEQLPSLVNKVTLQQIGYFALEQTCNAFGTDTHGVVRDVRRRRVQGREVRRSHRISQPVAARLILPASASLR